MVARQHTKPADAALQEDRVGTLASDSAEGTRALGRDLGLLLRDGDVVGLQGGLGAGKTCLTQGIAMGLGVEAGYRVTSPTFTLINEYPGRLELAHIDLYRLADEDEIWEIGVPEYMGGEGVCVVEWFDRCASATPPGYVRVELASTGEDTRRLAISARGNRHLEVARAWLQRTQPARAPGAPQHRKGDDRS